MGPGANARVATWRVKMTRRLGPEQQCRFRSVGRKAADLRNAKVLRYRPAPVSKARAAKQKKGPDCSGPFLQRAEARSLERVAQTDLHNARVGQQVRVVAKRLKRVEREGSILHVEALGVEHVEHVHG